MTEIHLAADDLRIGDVIVHEGGETAVRELARDGATIITNPGQPDEICGKIWEHAAVRREDSN